jgi:hypothetical protein
MLESLAVFLIQPENMFFLDDITATVPHSRTPEFEDILPVVDVYGTFDQPVVSVWSISLSVVCEFLQIDLCFSYVVKQVF